MPFTPSDTLVLDTARLRVWQQDDDYAYGRELVPAQKSLMDWLGEQFDQFWESVFGTAFYQEYSSLMWILVGGGSCYRHPVVPLLQASRTVHAFRQAGAFGV